GRRPARRPRGIMHRIPRIARRWKGQAEIGAANREFVGLVFAEQNRTGVSQPYLALRILLRHMMLVTPRARGGADAAGLVDVLEANRNAVQRSARASRGDFASGGARGIVQYRDIAVQFAVERIDPLQIGLAQSDRGEPPLGDRAASLGDGKKRRVHRRPQTL